MKSRETDFVCFGSILRQISVPKSTRNPSKIEPKRFEIEFGMPLWFCTHSGGAPGVPWGYSGASQTPFWEGFGFPNPSQIDETSTPKNDAFSEACF